MPGAYKIVMMPREKINGGGVDRRRVTRARERNATDGGRGLHVSASGGLHKSLFAYRHGVYNIISCVRRIYKLRCSAVVVVRSHMGVHGAGTGSRRSIPAQEERGKIVNDLKKKKKKTFRSFRAGCYFSFIISPQAPYD